MTDDPHRRYGHVPWAALANAIRRGDEEARLVFLDALEEHFPRELGATIERALRWGNRVAVYADVRAVRGRFLPLSDLRAARGPVVFVTFRTRPIGPYHVLVWVPPGQAFPRRRRRT